MATSGSSSPASTVTSARRVTLFERAPTLLPLSDDDVAAAAGEILRSRRSHHQRQVRRGRTSAAPRERYASPCLSGCRRRSPEIVDGPLGVGEALAGERDE